MKQYMIKIVVVIAVILASNISLQAEETRSIPERKLFNGKVLESSADGQSVTVIIQNNKMAEYTVTAGQGAYQVLLMASAKGLSEVLATCIAIGKITDVEVETDSLALIKVKLSGTDSQEGDSVIPGAQLVFEKRERIEPLPNKTSSIKKREEEIIAQLDALNAKLAEKRVEEEKKRIEEAKKRAEIAEPKTVNILEESIRSDPEDLTKYMQLAEAYAEIGQLGKGICVIEQFVTSSRFSQSSEPYRDYIYKSIISYFEKYSSLEQSLSIFEKLLTKTPSDIQVIEKLAKIYYSSGQKDKMGNILDNYLHSSESKDRFYKAGKLAFEAELFDKAILFLQQYVDENPNDLWGYKYLADTLLVNDQTKKAADVWEKGFANLNKDEHFLIEAGVFYRKIGQYDKAISLHTELFAKYYWRWDSLAQTYVSAGKWDKAEAVVNEYFQKDKDPHPAEVYKAQDILKTIGKEDIANELYEKYIKKRY